MYIGNLHYFSELSQRSIKRQQNKEFSSFMLNLLPFSMWHISCSKGAFFTKYASRNIRQVCYPAEQCSFWFWKLFVMLWKQALVKAELTPLPSKGKTGATSTDKKKMLSFPQWFTIKPSSFCSDKQCAKNPTWLGFFFFCCLTMCCFFFF